MATTPTAPIPPTPVSPTPPTPAATPVAPTANPFDEQLFKFFEQLNVVNGLLYFLDRRADDVKRHVRASLKAHKATAKDADRPFGFTGSSVPVSDLIADSTTYPSGGFASLKEEWDETLDEIVRRNAVFTVAQGYEIFENLLYDLLATYLFQFQAEADAAKLMKFNQKKAHQGAPPTEWVYWRRCAKFSFQENKEIIKILRHLAPGIATTEDAANNWRKRDLKVWYEVVSEVRHAATHANGVVLAARMKKLSWTKAQKEMLEIQFPSTFDADGNYSLKIPTDKAQQALSMFADYGFAIYKQLSIVKGFDWGVLP